MHSVCSNRGFVGDREPKVVVELSNKQHDILLGIATRIALEKVMVRVFHAILLLENAVWSKYCFPTGKEITFQ